MFKYIFIILLIIALSAWSYLFTYKSEERHINEETKNDNITKEIRKKLIKQECKKRREKQKILDELNYVETAMYMAWKLDNEKIERIDKILNDAISKASWCDGVYYHHINVQELFSFFVPKVSAKTKDNNKKYSKETIIVFNSIRYLSVPIDLAKYIAKQCESAKDRSHCYKYAVWVAKAESSVFKRCSYNNCYGIMERNPNRRIKRYISKKSNKNMQQHKNHKTKNNNMRPKDRINKSRYCTEHCQHWIKNVQYAIDQMNRPL